MGCHFKNESIPIGKKPNSMIKPFPNKIKMNVMKVIIENVVTVSISNPILINKFPRSNKYNPRQTIMKSVSITDNGKEDIAEKIHIEIRPRIMASIPETMRYPQITMRFR